MASIQDRNLTKGISHMGICRYSENVNGAWLVVSNDRWIRYGIEHVDLLKQDHWQFDQMISLIKEIRPNQTDVIDGGSNHGSWTIPLAKKHKDLSFHMFEVQRLLYYTSCGSVALNDAMNVHANLLGLSNAAGSMELAVPNYDVDGNFGALEMQVPFANSDHGHIYYTAKTETVKMVAIDDLGLSPVFIKLDLEGMEMPALAGAINTMNQHQPVVWCEVHKSNSDLLAAMMTDLGYTIQEDREKHWFFIPTWLKNDPGLADIFG